MQGIPKNRRGTRKVCSPPPRNFSGCPLPLRHLTQSVPNGVPVVRSGSFPRWMQQPAKLLQGLDAAPRPVCRAASAGLLRCSEANPRRPPGTQAAAQHPIPARALQAVASSAGTTRSGPPERRSARIASSAGAAGDSPKSSGAAGSTLFVFPVYFLEFLAFPALIRYTRLVKV